MELTEQEKKELQLIEKKATKVASIIAILFFVLIILSTLI